MVGFRCLSIYIRRRKLRTLIPFLLIMLVTTSFSIAQSNEKKDEIHALTVPYNIRNDETFKRNSENPRNRNARTNYRSNTSSDRLAPVSPEPGEGSGDISLSVKNELKSEKNLNLFYDSPSLKAEDLPLVMSSADKKTISVVLPPFLYFKTQF